MHVYKCELATLFFSIHLLAKSLNSTWSKANKSIAQKTFKSKPAPNEIAVRSKEHARQHGVSVCVFQGQISSCPLLACQAKM